MTVGFALRVRRSAKVSFFQIRDGRSAIQGPDPAHRRALAETVSETIIIPIEMSVEMIPGVQTVQDILENDHSRRVCWVNSLVDHFLHVRTVVRLTDPPPHTEPILVWKPLLSILDLWG